jgi:hypothetical protein
VLAALIAGVTEAFHSRIDAAVSDVVTTIRGTSGAQSVGSSQRSPEIPMRAD